MSAFATDTAFLARTMRKETVCDFLNRDLFFVKDAVKPSEAKLSDKLDVYDPDQCRLIFEVREPGITKMTKVSRLYGGTYDIGGLFDLAISVADGSKQAFRVSREAPTFVLNRGPV